MFRIVAICILTMLLCAVNTTARAHAVSCVCMNGVDSVMSVSIPATVPYEAPDSTAAARLTTDSGREVTDSLYISDRDTIRYKYTPLADSADETEPAAQVTDTIPARKPNFFKRVIDYFGKSAEDKTFEKRMDFTVVGGPSYSSKTSLSIGILAAGLYRVDRRDSITSPSNVSAFANVSIIGFYYVGIYGNTFFKQDRHRIDYELSFKSQPTDFWGFGYDDAVNNSAGSYTGKKYLVDIKYLYELFPNTYIGTTLNFNYSRAINLTKPEYLDGQKSRYAGLGLGTFIEYDSRDVITNPYKGLYVSIHGIIQPKAFGDSGHTLWRARTTIDYYKQLWKGGILALDLYGEFNSANTPWTMYATFGNSMRMRGYYEGQFNDLNTITFQAELRQRVWRRIGITVWGGAGNVFRSFGSFDWGQTLPNYGVGLRWEFKKRMNVRLDYGFGRRVNGHLINGLVMSINEAF